MDKTLSEERMVDEAAVAEQVKRAVAVLLPPGEEITLESPLSGSGLSSLTMTRLWFALRKEPGVDVGVQRLASCATVGELVDHVLKELRSGGERQAPEVTVDTAGRDEPYPVTELQQTYLIGKDPEQSADPVGCQGYREFTLRGVDPVRLGTAWNKVVEHNEALRVVFTPDGRQRIQRDTPSVPTPVHERTELSEEDFDRHVREVRSRLSHSRYPAGTWPTFTIEFSAGPDDRTVVHLSMDASITDAHGLTVALDEWWQWYQNPGRTIAAKPLNVRDCVIALTRLPDQEDRQAYWDQRLADLPPGPVPTKPTTEYRRTPLGGSLDAQQWKVVRDLAASWNVSSTALVLTVFADTIARPNNGQPFSVVLTTNNRAWLPDEAKGTIGPLTSWIVSPLRRTIGMPFQDAVRMVHEYLWADLEHAAVPEVLALRKMNVRGPQHPVVFTSLLNTLQATESGLFDAMTYAISQTTGVALDHQMWEKGGELRFRWDVLEAAFEPGVVRELFDKFVAALGELSAAGAAYVR